MQARLYSGLSNAKDLDGLLCGESLNIAKGDDLSGGAGQLLHGGEDALEVIVCLNLVVAPASVLAEVGKRHKQILSTRLLFDALEDFKFCDTKHPRFQARAALKAVRGFEHRDQNILDAIVAFAAVPDVTTNVAVDAIVVIFDEVCECLIVALCDARGEFLV